MTKNKEEQNDCLECGYKYDTKLENNLCEECVTIGVESSHDEQYQVA